MLLAAVVFVVAGTFNRPPGDLATSRLATVYSLVKHGTWNIYSEPGGLPNKFARRTVDKVMVGGTVVDNVTYGGEMISSKPPVLPLLMTAEYLALNAAFGWDLDNDDDVARVLYAMTLTFSGLPYLLGLWCFRQTLVYLGIDGPRRLFMTAALAAGTQLPGFSTLLQNHVAGAGAVIATLCLAAGMLTGALRPRALSMFAFGLICGFVPVLDMPVGIYAFAAAVMLFVRFPRPVYAWAVLGAAIPVAVQTGVLYSVTGSPFPVQVHEEVYLFETSYWRHPLGSDALSETRPEYLFHMTLGRRGLFSLYPVLLLGGASVLRALSGKPMRFRIPVIIGAVSFAILTAYYCRSTNNYGGETFGFRWYIGSMPVMLLMGAPLIERMRKGWHWALLIAMLAVSVFSAWQCATTGYVSGQEWTHFFLGSPFPPQQ